MLCSTRELGASVIDLGTLKRLGLDRNVDRASAKSLINASGNQIKILGFVPITIILPCSQPRDHIFQVLDNITYPNILLGRDFMDQFGGVRSSQI